jgi:hypothetical protein
MRNLTARALKRTARIISGEPPIPTYITDEFVTWLRYANAGMLEPGNLYLMDYAISRLPSDAPMLEIGSFCGLSTNILTHYKRKHRRTNSLFTCDKWEFENRSGSSIGGSSVSFDQYKQFVRDSFLRNIRTFSEHDLPFSIELFSSEFFDKWRQEETASDVFARAVHLGGPLSFCYVDGNHTHEGAKLDFENCDAFLQVGGFILFDDSTDKGFGVFRLMPEVLATGRYRLIAKNPNHLFQKVRK